MKKKKFKEKDFKSVRFENGQVFFGEENYNYKTFFKKYLWLHLIIIGALVLAIILTILAYSKGFTQCVKLAEPECWSTIISFSLAYFGAAFLGMIVFYNTCQRQYLEDKEANLKFNILVRPMNIGPTIWYSEEALKQVTFKHWGGQSKDGHDKETGDKAYLKFQIKNYNYRYPMYVKLVDAYYNDEHGNTVDVKSLDFKSTIEMDSPLDYKEDGVIFVGISSSILNKFPKTIAYVFKLKNVKGVEEYCLYFAALYEKTFSCVIKSISIEEYEQSMKDKKHPLGMWDVYLTLGQNK